MAKFIEKFNPLVAVVIGTRPGDIKFSPIVRELQKQEIPFIIVHTGQHYSTAMSKTIFEDLGLPDPDYECLDTRLCSGHGEQTACMLRFCESIFLRAKPRIVLVDGDANTNLAGGIAAKKLHCIVGHVEAGFRSWDITMPEEQNRRMLDHTCDILFSVNDTTTQNLKHEHVPGLIAQTGSTIVSAVKENLPVALEKATVRKSLPVVDGDYFLLTTHREENVDDYERLSGILEGASIASQKYKVPVIFPAHPRTVKRMEEFKICLKDSGILMIPAVGYLDMLDLEDNADLILTDSGGIQEEAYILGVPCVTLRDNTEREETLEQGANVLATGVTPEIILTAVEQQLGNTWEDVHPYGDEKAAERIVSYLPGLLREMA